MNAVNDADQRAADADRAILEFGACPVCTIPGEIHWHDQRVCAELHEQDAK